MIKKLALILAILMIVFLALSLSGLAMGLPVNISGCAITGPFGAVIGLWGLIVTTVILFCAAILLAFVFAGVGLVIIGSLAFVGVVLAAVLLPLMLPLIVPLFIVWVFCAILCRGKATKKAS